MRPCRWQLYPAVGRAARATAATLAGAVLAGCGAAERPAAPQRELRLAHVLTDKHPVHHAMARMAERVREKTGGSLSIDLRHSAQLGGETELLEKVQAGSIQMTKISSNALDASVPEMGLFALPFLFRDEEHFWRTLESDVGREILARLDSIGLKGLTWYDAGARSFYARDPITGVESLRGLRVRVQESPVMIETMRALGAIPVAIKFGPELTQQLQKGERVTAAENNAPSYWTEGHHRSCPYYFLTGHSRAPDLLVINLRAWNSLSADEQAALREAARESTVYQRRLWREETERIYRLLEQEGVRITHEVDPAPFIEAVQPIYDGMSPDRRAWVERIRAIH
jgi:tripartite ATP-independent transporter DctP family solute receptor